MSRLLESFAADEGFQMDGSSFSEEEEDGGSSSDKKVPQRERDEQPCILGKKKRRIVPVICNLFSFSLISS